LQPEYIFHFSKEGKQWKDVSHLSAAFSTDFLTPYNRLKMVHFFDIF
jgi:hypothetical protein